MSVSTPYRSTNHPELQDGEIWLTNATREQLDDIGWRTKRMGKQAYDRQGHPIWDGETYPVFVQKTELDEAGVSIGS